MRASSDSCNNADIKAQHLLELAADMAMNGAPFALLDAAFLVFPAWRTMTIDHGHVAHTPDGAWNPHNPDYPDEVLEAYRRDRNMFQTRIEHDLGKRLPTVEVVTGFGTVAGASAINCCYPALISF